MEFCGTAFSSRFLDRVQHLVRALANLSVIWTLYFEDALLIMTRVIISQICYSETLNILMEPAVFEAVGSIPAVLTKSVHACKGIEYVQRVPIDT
jgi:hypothetical protein